MSDSSGRPFSGTRPRWLADEMLGRLARYLRFVGHDVAYVQGMDDTEVARLGGAEGRRLVTRDRHLALRVPGALLISSPLIDLQFQEVVRASPGANFAVVFERCTLCNGTLKLEAPARAGAPGEASPRTTWKCEACGHQYWEGSHTASVRRRISEWVQGASS